MTLTQRRRFLKLISQRQEELKRRHTAHRDELAEPPVRDIGDFADEAVRDDALDMQCTLEEHDLKEIRSLEEARRRLEAGDFGICQDCGEPIGFFRLLVVPETQLCFGCAAEMERRMCSPRTRRETHWTNREIRKEFS